MPNMRNGFHCQACDAEIPHPNDEHDCPNKDGACAHLRAAGAVNVSVRVATERPGNKRGCTLFVTGGWLCRECAQRYGA